MKIKKDLWVLTLIAILAGFFIIRVLEAQNPQLGISSMLSPQALDQYFEGRSLGKIEEYLKVSKELEQERADLLEEIRALGEIISRHEKEAAEKIEEGEQIREELEISRMIAGMLDVEGPGVEIILDDRKGIQF